MKTKKNNEYTFFTYIWYLYMDKQVYADKYTGAAIKKDKVVKHLMNGMTKMESLQNYIFILTADAANSKEVKSRTNQ